MVQPHEVDAYRALHEGEALPGTALHRAIWQMKEPLARPNCWGHNYKVAKWSYDGVPLCRAGWMKIMGCAYQAHRDMYSLVLRGISPTEVACGNGAQLLLATNKQVQGQATEKQAFATSWLHKLVAQAFCPKKFTALAFLA